MSNRPFSLAIGSLIYPIFIRPYICYVVGNGEHVPIKPLRGTLGYNEAYTQVSKKTKDYMLVYFSGSLKTLGLYRLRFPKGYLL